VESETAPQRTALPPTAVVKAEPPRELIMIDTSGKKNQNVSRPASPVETERVEPKKKEKTVVAVSDRDDTTEPASGGKGKALLFGLICAAAAGAFIYAKKNNIAVEDIVRKNFSSFFQSFRK